MKEFESLLNCGEKVVYYTILLQYQNIKFNSIRIIKKYEFYKLDSSPNKKEKHNAITKQKSLTKFGIPTYINFKKLKYPSSLYHILLTIVLDLSNKVFQHF